MKSLGLVLFALSISSASLAWADTVPDCMARGQSLPVNNSQVLNWKQSTPNQFLSRGHIQGKLISVYPDHSGHYHFEVQIGADPMDTLEIIYNQEFGTIPTIAPGEQVEACGDYITSNAPSGALPASPDGAILHWVHVATNPRHESGYVAINGTVYGQTSDGN